MRNNIEMNLMRIFIALASCASVGCDNPCAFEAIDIEKYGNQPLQAIEEIRSNNGWLETQLTVKYAGKHHWRLPL